MNIVVILNTGESETVEFKKSTGEWKEIIKTISAFSNTRGGIILVGVNDKGNLIGVSVGKGTIEDLANKIIAHIEPKIYPEIDVQTLNGKKIIHGHFSYIPKWDLAETSPNKVENIFESCKIKTTPNNGYTQCVWIR